MRSIRTIGLLLAAVHAFARPAAAQHAPDTSTARATSRAALAADLVALRAIVDSVEKSWTPATRVAGRARLDSLAAALDTISPLGFDLAVARIVATADNGHSAVFPVSRARRTNGVGVRFVPFEDAFHVLRASPDDADLLGARLVAIDGVPVARVRDVARTLMPGTPGWRDRFVPLVLESPEQLRALGIARAADAATYRLRLADGRTVERRLVALPASASRPIGTSRQWMLAAPDTAGPHALRALRAARELPWSLRDPDVPFRLAAREDLDAVVIDLRQTYDAPGRPLAPFLDSARAEIARRRPRHLIVDLRLNGGGNLQLARDFMQSLPTLVPGNVFLLTSPWTFSAAISSAGYAKQADPRRVLLVGETVGDRLEFFAEGGPRRLPNSGIMVGISTQRHDYREGCRGARDCHPPVVRFPIAVPSLDPDIPAPWTMAAYREGRDPALEAIARWLSRQGSPRS